MKGTTGQRQQRRRAAMEPSLGGPRRGARAKAQTQLKAAAPKRLLRDGDVILAKQTPTPSPPPRRRPPTARRPARKVRPKAGAGTPATPAKRKSRGLTEWLTPKNIQKSLTSVSNLRGMVKNGLQYLQQADKMLETFYVTSNSLRESGVLEKLVKSRGKNLTTEDFTGILAALMSSPLGGQLFKAMSGGSSDSEAGTEQPTATTNNLTAPE